MKGFCYFLNVDTSETEKNKRDGFIIPTRHRPSYIHFFQEDAEKEVLRLAESSRLKGDGFHEFMLFKAIKMAKFDTHAGIFIIDEAFED